MSIYKILSLDPGLTVTGWAMSTYDNVTKKFTNLKFNSFKATKFAQKQTEDTEKFGQRIISLYALENVLCKLIDVYKPDYIACEDIFLHVRHVNAFAALVMCICILKRAAFTKGMVIYTMAPRAVKRIVTNTGEANKVAIQQAIADNKHIDIIENKQHPIDKMNEHEADAIAIGYAFCIDTLPTLLNISEKLVKDADVTKKKRIAKKVTEIVIPIIPANISINI